MPRILLVDDDTNFVEIAQALLEAGGHEVTPAKDGEQAWRLWRTLNSI